MPIASSLSVFQSVVERGFVSRRSHDVREILNNKVWSGQVRLAGTL